MEKLRTSLTIIRHSFDVLGRHPRLMVFPLLSFVAAVVVYAFFLVPLMFHMTMGEIWRALLSPGEGWASLAPWRDVDPTEGGPWQNIPIPGFIAYYLLTMFTVTFINVALYSQIIAAMNGGQASVSRGFALAVSKLPAILAWSLLAGTVGVLLRLIQERVGLLGRWIAALAGISLSAASVFVIPVMINEPRSRSPFDYLKTSATLLRRVWGEGVIGVGGLTLVYMLVFIPLMVLSFVLVPISSEFRFQIVTLVSLAGLVIISLLYLAQQIFECGLYVYASEGVAPGTFDEKLFDRAWTVRRGAAVENDPQPVGSRALSKLWLIFPILLGVAVLALNIFRPQLMEMGKPGPHLGSARIDLAALGYRLNMEDLQAAGLFVGEKCRKCDFSAEAAMESSYEGKPDDGLEVWMYKYKDQLWLHFYGKNVPDGTARIERSMAALRARFPQHANAVVLNPKTRYVPRTTVAEWNAIPGAASYTIEVDCYLCCAEGKWCADVGSKWKIEPDVKTTLYSFDWVGAQPGRWRVWAVDAKGHAGARSHWAYFDYSN